MKVIVVGSINQDISIKIHRFPLVGETMFSDSMSVSLGGKGLNQAIAVSRQNVNVDFIGAVGNDPFGISVINHLQKEFINTDGIKLIENHVTGTAVIMVDEKADNSIILDQGANFEITPNLIDEYSNKIKEADYCMMQCEIPFETIKYVSELCEKYQTKLIFNPAPYTDKINSTLLKKVFCIIPNEIELNQLVQSNEDTVEARVKKLHEMGSQNIIVTLGERGSYYSFDHGLNSGDIKAEKVEAIDTTAAGDTFIGAFVSEYVKNENLRYSIEYATKASAIAITRNGAVESIPNREEILKEL